MSLYAEIMAAERRHFQPTGKVCSELSRTPYIPWASVERHPLPAISKNEDRPLPQMRRVIKNSIVSKAMDFIKSKPDGWIFTTNDMEDAGFYRSIVQHLRGNGFIECVQPRAPGNKAAKYRAVKPTLILTPSVK